jgi:putative membrane protein
MHKYLWIAAAVALTGTAAACSSDEPSSKQDYPQPAASIGDEATPEEPTMQSPTTEPSSSPAIEESIVDETAVAIPENGMSREGDEPIAESLRDGQILKVVDLANTGEVQQAQLAKSKATNPQVKQFAAMMIKDHSQANQKAMKLAKAAGVTEEESPAAAKLELKASQTMDTLKAVGPSGFDAAYMSAQVEQHQAVLDMLSNTLVPSATNPKLKTELEATRTVVQRHLGHAMQIQETIAVAEANAIED